MREINDFRENFDDSRTWREYLNGLDLMLDKIPNVLEITIPTFDDVVKVWENTIDDKLKIQNNDEGIRILYPNGIYYLINREQVYSNRKVFSINVNAILNAINLTVEYLKNRQINESVKATK